MRSSDKKMNDILKAVIAFAVFIAAVIVISILVFLPYKKVWSKDNHYDVLFLGASRVYKGIQPRMIDEVLGSNSYSLASDSMSVEDRYVLLESALEQGSLKMVVLEISFDALTDAYDDQENGYVYEVEPMSKLEGLKRKLSFCNEKFNFWEDNYDNVYPALMSYGFDRWEQKIRGWNEEKGYVPFGSIAKGISMEEAAETHDSWQLNNYYLEEKKECVNRIIELCQANGIRVVLINTPDTEARLWQYYGWEVYYSYMIEVSEKYGLELYDFNLYKDRQSYFDDDQSFNDYSHLSEIGSAALSPILGDILKRGETEDLSDLFYDSYDEAKANSTYAPSIQ